MAREAERQRRRQLEQQWNGVSKRTLPPTVSQATKRWLEKRAGLEASTRETYAAALKHVSAHLGKTLVCDINAAAVAAYQRIRVEQGAAGASVNKEIACLSSILADHGLWAQIRRDVKRLKENESAGQALEPSQEKTLLESASQAALKQGHWSPIYTVTVLALNTGLRHSEVRQLR